MEAKFLASVISFLSIFLAIYADTDFLVPNYDNAEHQLKVFEIRSPLVLSCNITKAGDYVLKWEKNGTDITKVKELEGRYRILAAERKFIIDRTDTYDDGLYSCVADNQKKHINVVARVVVRVPSNTGVVEGEKLSIACTSIGTDPQLSWKIGNLTISNSTGRYILKPDDNQVKNAILSIENISLDDRGEFKCIGRNDANEYADYAEASDASFVRVKGKLAALWPFLGICAEVLILCAIILIYEKRRNKSELEESDTDPQDQKKKRRNYD
ncbi:neuroplastin isoform X3 [Rhagoletis pomonella]|uniref:neuroplastin isoform X3 n=1 Tax=Rhagoletis pomonella TaxID=28610 RepID=UPI0017840B52|nr:neuroplastin isoform X3 [Rhagoletis pomonella]